MNRYAAALSQHPVPAHAVGEIVGYLLEQLEAEPPDLLVLFASPHFAGALDDMTAVLRELVEPRVLIGMTAAAVIGGSVEAEEVPAVSAWAACLDGEVDRVALRTVGTAEGTAVSGWPPDDPETGEIATPGAGDTLLLLADPFTFPIEPFLERVADDWPGLQVVGGLASAAAGPAAAGSRSTATSTTRVRSACSSAAGRGSMRSCRRAAGRSARRTSSRTPRTTSSRSSQASRRWSASPRSRR